MVLYGYADVQQCSQRDMFDILFFPMFAHDFKFYFAPIDHQHKGRETGIEFHERYY